MPTPHRATSARGTIPSAPRRGLLVLIGLALAAGFELAWMVAPDSRGYGTHQQFGLPPCSLYVLFGILSKLAAAPRPSRITSAGRRWRPPGPIRPRSSCVLCTLLIPWSGYSAWRGRLWRISDPAWSIALCSVGLATTSLLHWSPLRGRKDDLTAKDRPHDPTESLSPRTSPPSPPPAIGPPWSWSRGDFLTLLFGASASASRAASMPWRWATKMIQGDPQTTAGFTVATGVDLTETGLLVATHVSCPTTMTRNSATPTFDIEQELRERMWRNDVQCVSPNEVSNILDAKGCSSTPSSSPARSRRRRVRLPHPYRDLQAPRRQQPHAPSGDGPRDDLGFAVEGGKTDDEKKNSKDTAKRLPPRRTLPPRTAIQVYEKEFQFEHPRNHPVPIDQTPSTPSAASSSTSWRTISATSSIR